MNQETLQLLLDRISLGAEIVTFSGPDGAPPLTAVRDGHTIVSLEKYLDAPIATRATDAVRTRESFLAMLERFRSESDSVVFCDVKTRTFTAIFDFDGVNGPAWRKHRASWQLELSRELVAWQAANGKPKGQDEFAEFLEERTPDFVSPDGAAMLEMALSFQARKAVSFQSAKRPGDGSVHFEYVEDVAGGRKGTGELTAPERVTIAIPLFYGEQRVDVDARFRYRIGPQGLVMWFDIYRLPETVDERVEKVRDGIRGAVACTIFDGPAPGAP